MRILEKHPPPPSSKYERCRKQVPYWRLKNQHYTLDKRRLGEEWQRQLETPQKGFEATRVVISVKLESMDPTVALLYLGLLVASNNSGWVALYHNLKKD